jgi:glycosyltransferase involved in cell wall biosynthesis
VIVETSPVSEPHAATSAMAPRPVDVAVFVPCLNEALTIRKVVEDFRRALPDATVYVIDNGSTDDTAAIAEAAGAVVMHETRRGKGFAVRTALREIDAEVYVMVDGDDTYPAEAIPGLLTPVVTGRADMVVGSRVMAGTESEFRPLNRVGNILFPWLLRLLLRVRITDLLSGYRVMSRQLVKNLPIAARDFEVEAELTIKALERHYRVVELPVNLRARPEGSFSKIRVMRDGRRILWTIILLFRDYRPMSFFGGLGLLFLVLSLIPGIVVIVEFLDTGLVLRLPSAVLAAALALAGLLSIAVGLVLSAVIRRFQELENRLEMLTSRRRRD